MKSIYVIIITAFVIFTIKPVSAYCQNSKSPENKLVIESFSTLPSEINGCSCYFSNDSVELKSGKYIFVNDFAQTSYLKINGTMTKFTQTEFEDIDFENTVAKYNNNSFELIVQVKKGQQIGYETISLTGTIKITDKKGNTISKGFYGFCGC
jgi:hypothetical protein